MKSRVPKILKIICIVIAAVILFVTVGGIILYNTVFKEPVKNMITMIDKVIYEDDFLNDLMSEDLLDEIDKYIEKEIANGNDEVQDTNVIGTDGSVEAIINDAKNNFISGQKPSTDNTQSTDININDNQEQTKLKEDYKSKFEYIKDNVAAFDFAIGIDFASRIDASYILGLLQGGLTNEEKSELKRYLKKNFSDSEISQGIALYSKYSYLLK